jgi:hypothetical protein
LTGKTPQPESFIISASLAFLGPIHSAERPLGLNLSDSNNTGVWAFVLLLFFYLEKQ